MPTLATLRTQESVVPPHSTPDFNLYPAIGLIFTLASHDHSQEYLCCIRCVHSFLQILSFLTPKLETQFDS